MLDFTVGEITELGWEKGQCGTEHKITSRVHSQEQIADPDTQQHRAVTQSTKRAAVAAAAAAPASTTAGVAADRTAGCTRPTRGRCGAGEGKDHQFHTN